MRSFVERFRRDHRACALAMTIAAAASLIFILLFPLFDATTANIYSVRDFYRALDLWGGQMIWHGPELSRFGFTTGPFFYFLTAPLAALGEKAYTISIFVFLSVALAGGWFYLRRETDDVLAFILIALFMTTEINLTNTRMVWNPSFLPLFWIILAAALHRFSKQQQFALRSWLFFCFGIGLVAQIHVSSFYWFPLAILILPFSFHRLALGGLAVAIPQLPFFIWASGQPADPAALVDPSVSFSVLRFLSARFEFFGSTEAIENIVRVFGWPLLLLTLASLALARSTKKHFVLVFALVFSTVLASQALERRVQLHYLLPALFSMMALIAMAWTRLNVRAKLPLLYRGPPLIRNFTFAIGLAAVTLPTVHAEIENINGVSKFIPRARAQRLTEVIYQNTGWSLDDFRLRTLMALRGAESSLDLSYQQAIRKIGPLTRVPDADGALIISKAFDDDLQLPLTKSSRPTRWQNWIRQGRLQILKSQAIDEYRVLTYSHVGADPRFNLQNIGESYPRARTNYFTRFSGLPMNRLQTRIDPHEVEIFFYRDVQNSRLILHSSFLATFRTAGPQAFIDRPAILFECDGARREIQLPSLGFKVEGSRFKNAGASDALLSPFILENMKCRELTLLEFRTALLQVHVWTDSQHGEKTSVVRDFVYDFKSQRF